MNIDDIRRQALSLPLDQRALLAEQLLASLDAETDREVSELWLEEAARRAAEIDRGAVDLVTAEKLESQVAALFR